ncbi:MAG: DMT family transporter [Victivallales bacterium]|nr:DMT family transporter [Victivallales bacterium]
MSDLSKGIISAILGSVSIAFMGVSVKLIGDNYSNFTLLFFRFFISLLILLPLILRDRNFSFKIKFPVLYFFRILFGFIAIACYFFAILKIPLTNAILLESTYPVFVPIVIFLITKEKTNLKVIAGIIISFIGITLIIQPDKNIVDIDSLIGLSAGICAAVSYVFLRLVLFNDKTQVNNILFYFFLFCTLVSAPIMLADWHTPDLTHLIILISVGLFGYGYQFFVTNALKLASVKIVSPLIYISVIIGGFADWLIWNDCLPMSMYFGSAITILGAVITILFRDKYILKK